MMHGHEKSDLAIVAVKPTNNAECEPTNSSDYLTWSDAAPVCILPRRKRAQEICLWRNDAKEACSRALIPPPSADDRLFQ